MPNTDPFPGLWKRFALLALTVLLPLAAHAQTLTLPDPSPSPTPAPVVNQPAPAPGQPTPAPQATSAALDQLTQSNRDLLDLLKKQQGVLEDIQYDRRLQSRQIENLEVRLTETIQQNGELQAKIAKLQAQLDAPSATAQATTTATNTPPVVTPTPAPPVTYLPPPEPEAPPGTKFWHRIYNLSGTDNETSDPIHINGHSWRVLWHNQDKDGDMYKNTSGLFIDAFAKGDTIPQKVCAKVGSAGDSSELVGPGDFVLKIDASGGKWELAVEDFY